MREFEKRSGWKDLLIETTCADFGWWNRFQWRQTEFVNRQVHADDRRSTVNRRSTWSTDGQQTVHRAQTDGRRSTASRQKANTRVTDEEEQEQMVASKRGQSIKKHAVEYAHRRVGTSCKYNRHLGNRTGFPFVCEITPLNSRRYLNFHAYFFNVSCMQPILELCEWRHQKQTISLVACQMPRCAHWI